MEEDFMACVDWVATKLMYSVPATQVDSEMIVLKCGPGLDQEMTTWSKQMTTYTLGLMLKGALAMEEDSLSERR